MVCTINSTDFLLGITYSCCQLHNYAINIMTFLYLTHTPIYISCNVFMSLHDAILSSNIVLPSVFFHFCVLTFSLFVFVFLCYFY